MPVPAPYADRPAPHPVIKHTPSHSLPTCGLGFHIGLASADNASAIKDLRAQACIPPMYTAPLFSDEYPAPPKPATDDGAAFLMWPPKPAAVPAAPSCIDNPRHITPDASTAFGRFFTSHATTPPFDFGDNSPAFDSSPLGPLTPFGDYVDRALVAPLLHTAPPQAPIAPTLSYSPFKDVSAPQDNQNHSSDTIIPSATSSYKKLAEPLAQWVASYIWEVCTTGFSLPAEYAQAASVRAPQFALNPPPILASSIHSLLLSTLLQPSGVLLALWYVARLPCYLAAAPLPADAIKEHVFLSALLDDGAQPEAGEATTPFRLVLLGFMLANKWLDDHTFSNKTWHSISNVPIQTLNRLESAALDIFNYDLSIPNHQWSQWLGHLLSYHQAMSSSGHPQPISRPSTNPHTLIKKAIEEIRESSIARFAAPNLPVPVFMGLEERIRERMIEHDKAMDISDIDLDEDGPLREEHVPKRRTSTRQSHDYAGHGAAHQNWDVPKPSGPKILPPPAKWSPAGDEPILRDRNRNSAHYVAVQPSAATTIGQYVTSRQEQTHNQNWNPAFGYYSQVPYATKPQSAYNCEVPSLVRASRSSFAPFGQVAPSIQAPHNRTQSLSYDHENLLRNANNHLRSFSQASYVGAILDMGLSRDIDGQWAGHYPYRGPAYILSTVGM